MSTLWKISLFSGTAITAFLAGKYQSQLNSDLYILDKPSISLFPEIRAAEILENKNIQPPNLSDVESKTVYTKSDIISKEQKNIENALPQIMKYGFPSLDNIKSYDGFVLSYNTKHRIANWVFEHLDKQAIQYNNIDRSQFKFFEDESIHPYFRSTNSDYKGSGYDRGHLAAAGNHKWTEELTRQTFVLSNMAPQVGRGFNRDYWNSLEKYVRKLTRKHSNVFVCTGPLFLPKKESDGKTYIKYQVIGKNNVAVPTHFFKIVVIEVSPSVFEVEAYVLPNAPIDDKIPLSRFLVPLDSIERAAGLLFFQKIPKHQIKKINGKSTN